MINLYLKRFLLVLNLFSVLLLLLGFLAGHVSPFHGKLLIFFGLAFPFFAWVNLFFLLFWGFIKKRYFFISLLALLVCFQPLNATFNIVAAKKTSQSESSFTLLSHNVKVFDLYNWSQNKKSRNEYFRFLRNIGADIACFQEFFNSGDDYLPIHDSLIKNQKFKYSHIYYSVRLKNGHNFGIATYSKYPIIKRKNISFGKTHNLAIASDIVIKGDTLRIINCHLQSVKFLKEDYLFLKNLPEISEEKSFKEAKGVFKRLIKASLLRQEQVKILKRELNDSPFPVIICGDFNDVPTSFTLLQFSESMNDSFHMQGMGINATYPRFLFPFRIDYILYENSIQCHHFRTLKSKLSDHNAIIGKYSMSN